MNPSLILFGACDRHNLGDLLFPHIAAALLVPREIVVAGLAARDLTAFGGHRVRAIGELEQEMPGAAVIHVGGELLACDAWEAAVMLLPPEEAPGVIAHLDGTPQRFAWARRYLGRDDRAPYCLGKSQSRQYGARIFCGVGGVDLDRRNAALREEVLAKLREADWIGVRDRATRGILAQAGIAAHLVPDPAVLTAELFGERIRGCALGGEPAEALRAFPRGYIAVQFAAEFGDDATLSRIAEGLDALCGETGCGVALFRAGAAPWHDDLACYRAVAARLRAAAHIFESPDIWDICALIAGARAFCGSSLHGRIVAQAFGVPVREGAFPIGAKTAAYRATWAGCEAGAACRTTFAEWRALLTQA